MSVTHAGVEFESMSHDSETETTEFVYDPEEAPATLAVAAALSKALDVAPTAIDPLQEIIDAAALDELLSACGDENLLSVSLNVSEHTIIADNDGTVAVQQVPDPTDEGVDSDDR